MKIENMDEVFALPVCCNIKNSVISDFKLSDKYKDQVSTISYKDDIILKFIDVIDSSEFNLKLFDNKIDFEGQVPLILYSDSLDSLLDAEASVIFELKTIEHSDVSFNSKLKEMGEFEIHNSCYEFSEYLNYCNDILLVRVCFENDSLIIDADLDNIALVKQIISTNFCIGKDKIIINPINNDCVNILFSISFNAVLQGIIIAKRIGRKVNVLYYKRHFLMAQSLSLKFSVINCLSAENRIAKIIVDLEINRPLNFLYKFYFDYLKHIFSNLFFDVCIHINFMEIKSNSVFFYDNHFLFGISVYNFIYSNFYNIAVSLSIEPLSYLLSYVKKEYNVFLKLFREIDLKNSIMRKSSAISLNKEYNIFDVRRKGIGFSFLSLDSTFLGINQTVSISLHKDKLEVFIPYKGIDVNLINYLRNILARTFNLSYNNVNFIVSDIIKNDVKLYYGTLIKESYVIEREVIAIKDNLAMIIGKEDFHGEYPIIVGQNFVLDMDHKINVACSLEIDIEINSFNITFSNVNFFIGDGKFDKLRVNNKRVFSIFSLAVDYVFGSITYDIVDSVALEFIEDGEFVFSFRALFIASISAIRTALIQAFDFNVCKTPIDFNDILNSWSVRIDTN
ncbi:hypothetical protein F9Y90_01480 [Borrelia miyamotoi]|uniref:Uncharacterized protein n=1 Tax=Borrelia miyamotoi TaxID=47466 RepID=A0AAX3JMD2_9SPIR|nr:hypothetical protein [Borrelia miyamotoi]QFP41799.1 hypothetical protein F9Y90_01480 [Borrelia miyamotoi]QFP47919.1 hypothetical protein F9Y91_01475 [Borrelia miyamotoi]QGT55679.1 hypothetical protein GNY89_01485 [Borrelia miyamotoi]QGT56462.1 hypothetical protein GNY88_01485 [Borrelia miyamotoi]WAZ71708.1 hypothetical protein O5404_01490 [Borrelia miyamotoi]